jgi:hypothetical protein
VRDAPHWTAKAEYLYATFKSAGFVSVNTFDPTYVRAMASMPTS